MYTKNNNFEIIYLFSILLFIIFILLNILIIKNIFFNDILHSAYVIFILLSIVPYVKNKYILFCFILLLLINIYILIYLGNCPFGKHVYVHYLPKHLSEIIKKLKYNKRNTILLFIVIIIVNIIKIFYYNNINGATSYCRK